MNNNINDQVTSRSNDLTIMIGDLDAARQQVKTVERDVLLSEATDAMSKSNYSQLPVVDGAGLPVGVISWKSIGERLSSGGEMKYVYQCMEDADNKIVSERKPLLEVVDNIAEHDYIMVKSYDGKISGIVTASDLSRKFKQMTEAFALIGEIEYYLRELGKRADSNRAKETWDYYVKLAKNKNKWRRLNLNVCQTDFLKRLKLVENIRHKVMHFDKKRFTLAEGLLSSDDARQLSDMVKLLQHYTYGNANQPRVTFNHINLNSKRLRARRHRLKRSGDTTRALGGSANMQYETIGVWWDGEGDMLWVNFADGEGDMIRTKDGKSTVKVDDEGNILGFQILGISKRAMQSPVNIELVPEIELERHMPTVGPT